MPTNRLAEEEEPGAENAARSPGLSHPSIQTAQIPSASPGHDGGGSGWSGV